MEGYNENVDYKHIHIEWIKANPRFRPKLGLMPIYNTYLEQMMSIYQETIKMNSTAYLYLKDDYNWSKKSQTVNEEVAGIFGEKIINKNPSFFVTFNWNDDNFNSDKIIQGLQKLFRKSWIDKAEGVFEYHGKEGNHPHFHCLIQVNKHKTFGRFKDKIFQSAVAKTLDFNFIDIKIGKDYHVEYVDCDKRQEKQEYLEKDIVWRGENGLLERYTKENI